MGTGDGGCGQEVNFPVEGWGAVDEGCHSADLCLGGWGVLVSLVVVRHVVVVAALVR
jgi:hypothetical protein